MCWSCVLALAGLRAAELGQDPRDTRRSVDIMEAALFCIPILTGVGLKLQLDWQRDRGARPVSF